ncbi:Voltage-gated ion channel [Globisporangium polare]
MASSPPSTSSLPPRSPHAVFLARAPSRIKLQRTRSDLVTFSSIPSAAGENVDTTDADEQEARDEPAPKLHRVGSVRRILLTTERRPLERRYSVDEQASRDQGTRNPKRREYQHQQPIESGQSSGDTSSEQSAVQQSGSGVPKGVMERLQNTVALKRLSRGSLLPSSTSSFFAAAMAATANAAAKEDAAGQQYEEMMERFQIRRLQHTASTGSNGAGKDDSHTHALAPAARSGKVIPASDMGDGVSSRQSGHSNNPTPRPHSTHSKNPAPTTIDMKDLPRQTPSGSESAAQSSEAPVLVIKPRSSIQKAHEGAAKTAASGSSSSSGRFSLHWKLVSWRRKLRRRCREFTKRIVTPLSPFSTAARVRGLVLLLAFLAHAIYFPVGVAFSSTGRHWFYYVDLGTEFVFMVDFVLSFNTSFQDKRGVLVTPRREIARNYIRGWCIPELLAAMPVESILFFKGQHDNKWNHVFMDGVFRMQRLVHVVRILRLIWIVHAGSSGKSIWAWLIYSRYSHLVRIFWIILLIVLLTHYMACCWKLLEDPGTITNDSATQSTAEQYAANFYDALQLLQGQGLTTSTIGQSVFASLAVLLGSIVLAIVFGNVAMLVSNFNANSTNYQRKMESVFAIMSKLQLPALLRERIHQYYEHLWREYESLDGEIVKFSKDLTHNLALEVVLFKYMDLVLNVPFWRDCTPDFQKQIALSLQVRVYLPDDFILRRGEVGDEFYMINRGRCELSTGADSFEQATAPLNPRSRSIDAGQSSNASRYANSAYYGQTQTEQLHEDGETEFDKRSRLKTERAKDHDGETRKQTSKHTRLLARGQAFGEIALLMNYQRTANVRAVTYVEMCVLSRVDFQTILRRYPDDRKHVLSSIFITCMESNETRQVYCPLKAIVELVFADGDARMADQISARYAANIISTVVNPDYEDDNMKFGIGQNFKKELKKLKDQDEAHGLGDGGSKTPAGSQQGSQPSKQVSRVGRIRISEKAEASVDVKTDVTSETPRSPTPMPSDLEDRILKIEDTQMQTLLILQEMQAAMDELRQISLPMVYISSGSDGKAQQQQSASALDSEKTGSLTTTAVITPFTPNFSSDGGDAANTQQGSKVARVPTRNFPLMHKRSTTAPDLLVLSQALAHEISMERTKDTPISGVPDASTMTAASTAPPANKRLRTEPPNAFDRGTETGQAAQSFSCRRSVTVRDLTQTQKTELSSVKSTNKPPLPAIEQRRLTFRLRKKTSQPDMPPLNSKAMRNGSSLTKRLLMQHVGSLVSFISAPTQATTQQSPTCYADQLFHTREPSGGSVNAVVQESISSEAI